MCRDFRSVRPNRQHIAVSCLSLTTFSAKPASILLDGYVYDYVLPGNNAGMRSITIPRTEDDRMPDNSFPKALLALILAAFVASCGPAPIPSGIDDPNEKFNRRMHAFNTGFDRVLVRPASEVYGGGLPSPIRRGVSNMSHNFDLPRSIANDIMQFRLEAAVHNTWRFAINSTIGIVGLFDPATKMGLDRRKTDFGETLYLWGVHEGSYQEVPVIGPSTARDTAGVLVDFWLNPLWYVLPSPEKWVSPTANVMSRLGDRYTYSATVDSILYESADSYAQTRSLFLQNRRFELRRLSGGAKAGGDDYFDPYASDQGGAAAPSGDAPNYIDPYEELQ
jgi:phospholipid-binding lipoprotein MlaA